MKKKILALVLAVFTLTLCACGAKNVPHAPTTDTPTEYASLPCGLEATVTHTMEPGSSVKIPEPVNGTYECGCADLFHGDYRITIGNGVTVTCGGKDIAYDELARGELIAMHFSGVVLETYPGQPVNVKCIEVLPEGAKAEDYETATCKVLRVSCILGSTVFVDEIKN